MADLLIALNFRSGLKGGLPGFVYVKKVPRFQLQLFTLNS